MSEGNSQVDIKKTGYTEISMNAKYDLLKILHRMNPAFATLFKSPRTVPIVDMDGGKYCSFSIKEEVVTYHWYLLLPFLKEN